MKSFSGSWQLELGPAVGLLAHSAADSLEALDAEDYADAVRLFFRTCINDRYAAGTGVAKSGSLHSGDCLWRSRLRHQDRRAGPYRPGDAASADYPLGHSRSHGSATGQCSIIPENITARRVQILVGLLLTLGGANVGVGNLGKRYTRLGRLLGGEVAGLLLR